MLHLRRILPRPGIATFFDFGFSLYGEVYLLVNDFGFHYLVEHFS